MKSQEVMFTTLWRLDMAVKILSSVTTEVWR